MIAIPQYRKAQKSTRYEKILMKKLSFYVFSYWKMWRWDDWKMAIRLRWRNGTQNPSLCAIIENTFDVVRLVFWLWLWKNKLNKNIVVCKCPKPPFQNKIKKHVCSSYKKKNTEALKKGEIIKRPLLNHGFLQCFSF